MADIDINNNNRNNIYKSHHFVDSRRSPEQQHISNNNKHSNSNDNGNANGYMNGLPSHQAMNNNNVHSNSQPLENIVNSNNNHVDGIYSQQEQPFIPPQLQYNVFYATQVEGNDTLRRKSNSLAESLEGAKTLSEGDIQKFKDIGEAVIQKRTKRYKDVFGPENRAFMDNMHNVFHFRSYDYLNESYNLPSIALLMDRATHIYTQSTDGLEIQCNTLTKRLDMGVKLNTDFQDDYDLDEINKGDDDDERGNNYDNGPKHRIGRRDDTGLKTLEKNIENLNTQSMPLPLPSLQFPYFDGCFQFNITNLSIDGDLTLKLDKQESLEQVDVMNKIQTSLSQPTAYTPPVPGKRQPRKKAETIVDLGQFRRCIKSIFKDENGLLPLCTQLSEESIIEFQNNINRKREAMDEGEINVLENQPIINDQEEEVEQPQQQQDIEGQIDLNDIKDDINNNNNDQWGADSGYEHYDMGGDGPMDDIKGDDLKYDTDSEVEGETKINDGKDDEQTQDGTKEETIAEHDEVDWRNDDHYEMEIVGTSNRKLIVVEAKQLKIKKVTKKRVEIDFEDDEDDIWKTFKPHRPTKKQKVSPTLTLNQLSELNNNTTGNTHRFNYDFNSFNKLFIKPNFKISKRKQYYQDYLDEQAREIKKMMDGYTEEDNDVGECNPEDNYDHSGGYEDNSYDDNNNSGDNFNDSWGRDNSIFVDDTITSYHESTAEQNVRITKSLRGGRGHSIDMRAQKDKIKEFINEKEDDMLTFNTVLDSIKTTERKEFHHAQSLSEGEKRKIEEKIKYADQKRKVSLSFVLLLHCTNEMGYKLSQTGLHDLELEKPTEPYTPFKNLDSMPSFYSKPIQNNTNQNNNNNNNNLNNNQNNASPKINNAIRRPNNVSFKKPAPTMSNNAKYQTPPLEPQRKKTKTDL